MHLRAVNLHADMDLSSGWRSDGWLDGSDLEFRPRWRTLCKQSGRPGEYQNPTPYASHRFIYALHFKKIRKLRGPSRALFGTDRADDEPPRCGWIDARFRAFQRLGHQVLDGR